MLPIIGNKVLIQRVLASVWPEIGGLLPIIGDKVLIYRILASVWPGIVGLLPMIGDKVLADHSGAPVTAVVRWLEQIARALRHTHQRGLLHCDLKPSNVLLDVEEQAQLADFGQAVLRSQETRSLGSLGFMAPEQAEAGAVPDVRWDVYALGATAYFLLSGQRPRLSDERIRSTTPNDLLADYRGNLGPLVPLPVDADLWQLLKSCLQLDPALRPEGMGEFLEDLERRRKRRPLLCRRPWSSAYLVRRFVQRNALSVVFSAIVLGILLMGLVG